MTRRIQPLVLPPGFDKRSTSLLAEGRWFDGDKIRSVGGVIQTMGGFAKFQVLVVVNGIARAIRTWRALDNTRNIAIGTHKRLYHWSPNAAAPTTTITDITPLRDSGTLGLDPFTTVSGSPVVTVADTSHGVLECDGVNFQGATAVGGITIDGDYEVTTVIDADTYTITHSSSATSSATGGGAAVAYEYQINVGRQSPVASFGYGVGPYGKEPYGLARQNASLVLDARTWSIWNAGEDIIAVPRTGDIYKYDYSAGGRAALLTNAPLSNSAVMVVPERHVVAIGAGGVKMNVQWSDIDDDTLWAPAASNQAGSFELRGGSELIAGLPLRERLSLIWSDTHVFTMAYLTQDPFFSLRVAGEGVGLVGAQAMTEMDGIAYWMGDGNFYQYDGFAREIPNQDRVKEWVFKDDTFGADRSQLGKTFCFYNSTDREIWWLYQSMTSATGDVDRYVMFNIDEREWYTGSYDRTVWDQAEIFEYPIAVDVAGTLYDQENGDDADGVALQKTLTSGHLDLGEGERSVDIFGFWGDFLEQSGDITLNWLTRDHPNETNRIEGPYPITDTDVITDTRANGRQAQLQLISNTLGGKFKLGKIKAEIEPKGMRR